MLSDPKAVQYFYHTSGYTFPKPADRKEINRLFTGPGILCADGIHCLCFFQNNMDKLTGLLDVDHARHRKVISPAFNFGVIREYVPVFNYHAAKVSAVDKSSLEYSIYFQHTHPNLTQLTTKWKESIAESPDGQSVFNLCNWYAKTTLDALGIGE